MKKIMFIVLALLMIPDKGIASDNLKDRCMRYGCLQTVLETVSCQNPDEGVLIPLFVRAATPTDACERTCKNLAWGGLAAASCFVGTTFFGFFMYGLATGQLDFLSE